jgi:hypothetical protein
MRTRLGGLLMLKLRDCYTEEIDEAQVRDELRVLS